VLDESLRHHLHHATSLEDWTSLTRQHCTKSLREDGIMKVEAGLTTIEEVLKVVGRGK